MAQYLVSVWHDQEYEVDFSSDEAQRLMAQVGQFNADLDAANALVFACGLQPASTAMVMNADGANVSSTKGPYATSDQHMGGFWVIAVDDEAAATEWGRRAALACEGPIEVRALQG